MAKKSTTAKKTKTAKATKVAATAKKTTAQKSGSNLYRWNILTSLVLFVQALAILVLSKTVYKLPISTNFLTNDVLASNAAGHNVLVSASRHLFDINLMYVVVAFLFVSAVVQGLVATRLRSKYEAEIKAETNSFRWIGYAITASIMFVAIALLNGIYDVSSLLMIIVLVVLLNLFGRFTEVTAGRVRRHSYLGLLAAGAAVWAVIAMYLKDAAIYGTALPARIYWIDGSLFVITLLLAANTYLLLRKKGKWADYRYGEQVYIFLGLVAQTALAWQIFFGFLK